VNKILLRIVDEINDQIVGRLLQQQAETAGLARPTRPRPKPDVYGPHPSDAPFPYIIDDGRPA
jgi:hypothetical protein